jgi:hypothetical protein
VLDVISSRCALSAGEECWRYWIGRIDRRDTSGWERYESGERRLLILICYDREMSSR